MFTLPERRPCIRHSRFAKTLRSLLMRGAPAADVLPQAEAVRLASVHRLRDRVIAARDPMGTQGFAGLHQGAKMRDGHLAGLLRSALVALAVGLGGATLFLWIIPAAIWLIAVGPHVFPI